MPELSEAEKDYIAEHLTFPAYGTREGAEMSASILDRLNRPVKVVVVAGYDGEEYQLEEVGA